MGVGTTHAIAVSNIFQAELMLKPPLSLESTMSLSSPLVSMGLSHCIMCFLSWPGMIAGCPVTSSNRTIPKL